MLTIFAKTLHHRFLIGFLNMSLDNTVKKIKQKTSPQSSKTFCFFFLIMYILFCETNKKTCYRKKKINPKVSDPFTHIFKKFFPARDQTFMTSTKRMVEKVLKFVICLQIIVFKQQIYCSFLWKEGGWGMVCGRHNCMIPNIKTYFDKKVTFLVKQAILAS